MKSFTDFFSKLDEKMEEKAPVIKKILKKYFIIFSVTLFLALVFFFVWRNFKSRPYFSAILINTDISKILDSLSKIDRDCSILEIQNDRDYIDFLSVEKFKGSEVGPLNLAYSKNWKGPYVQQNPVFQGKLYEIVKAKDGIFIVPGQGASLPNGYIIGKDFKVDKNSEILEMLKKGGKLNFEGRPLAVKIDFVIGDWDQNFKTKMEKINHWKKMIDEFNAAIPFTMKKKVATAC
ncbi:MAG: hypothetical protein ABIA74_00510 [bacterium]